MIGEFKNEPLIDFTNKENVKKMEEAILEVERSYGKEYPLIIDGERVYTERKFESINPSEKNKVVGLFQRGDEKLAEEAIKVALERFESWKRESVEKRVELLFKAASVMRKRRFELMAQVVIEVGKNWVEADADIAEAIDFCEYYGREMLRYSEPQPLVRIESEENELFYIPLGVVVVIPPWNFPLAILTGMTVASVVTGNTVVLKPSSDAPGVAYKFMEVMEEAGMPPGIINLVTGPGSLAGEYLVKHPKTRMIAFTGSKEVGLRIVENAAKTMPGQIWIKRVIAEMGGKDFIIVDSEADLDKAVEGVIVSAYGFQGQKCSACSRAIVLEDVYDLFVEKLVERARKITIGPAKYKENFMGPVINEGAFNKIMSYIEIGKREGKLVLGGEPGEDYGYYIKPTIFIDVDPKATIAQEEIFGPVLAVIKAKDFEEAIRIANDTEYGLTGSVYSRNKEKLRIARDKLFVGNLYFNRKCTGALVGVHPFGGFNMSGTDSKAGGRDYLLLFLQAKSVSGVKF